MFSPAFLSSLAIFVALAGCASGGITPPTSPDVGRSNPETSEDRSANRSVREESVEAETELFVDSAHAGVSRAVSAVADRIDRFFVDDRIDEGFNETRVRVLAGPRIADRENVELVQKFDLNLQLPRWKRASLIFTTFEEDEEAQEFETSEGDDDGVATALRVFLVDRSWARLNVDGGAHLKPQIDPYARIRLTRSFSLWETYLFRPAQFLFWELEDGYGETTRFDLERRWGATTLARLRQEATFAERNPGVRFNTSASAFRVLGDHTGLRARASALSQTEPTAVVREYRLDTRLRRRIYERWFFVELGPFLRFLRERDYDVTPGIEIRFEVQFGRDLIEGESDPKNG